MFDVFPYVGFSIGVIVVVYLFETWLDLRQHVRYSERKRPAELEDVVDDATFLKSQAYNHDKSAFGLIHSLYNIVETLVLYSFGIYLVHVFWVWAIEFIALFGLDASYEKTASIAFVSLQYLYGVVTGLPWSLYSTFRVEQKHGFNKSDLKTFVLDELKGLFLFFVLAPPLVAIFVLILRWGGEYFYIYVWMFMFAVQLVLITVYPTLIQPLFNKVEPLPDGSLKTKIEALAAKTGFPLTQIYVIDGSKRSSHSNAYFYGFFKNKRIVLFDTLIEQCSEEEVVAILGHELGHYFKWHTFYNLAIVQLHLFITFFIFGKFMHNPDLYAAFGFQDSMPVVVGFMLFQFIYAPVGHILSFLMNVFSRKNEFEADEFSAKLGKSSDLQRGLITISKENLGNMNPDKIFSAYHFSHPPLVERLHALRSHDKKQKTH